MVVMAQLVLPELLEQMELMEVQVLLVQAEVMAPQVLPELMVLLE
jgi:hypothetical protein